VTGVMSKLGLMVHQAVGLVIREESDWRNVKVRFDGASGCGPCN